MKESLENPSNSTFNIQNSTLATPRSLALLRSWPSADGDGEIGVGLIARQPDYGLLARLQRGDQVEHGGGVGHRLIVHRKQDVAGLHPCFIGGAAALDLRDQHATRRGQLE